MKAYKILRNEAGERFVKLSSGSIIPAAIARHVEGLRDIACRCRDCGEKFPLRDLNDTGEYCEECVTKGIEVETGGVL